MALKLSSGAKGLSELEFRGHCQRKIDWSHLTVDGRVFRQ